MEENPVAKLVEQHKDVLVNSRLFGHKKHPTITDVPFGSWTVTVGSDVLEMAGREPCKVAGDISIGVGLTASVVASLGGLADLSETYSQEERRLGMLHGIFHGVTMLLYGSSLAARRAKMRALGRGLGFAGYGTLLAASYLANELRERRSAAD